MRRNYHGTYTAITGGRERHNSKKAPLNHNGSEVFLRLGDYASISIVTPDLKSTVKWSSKTVIYFRREGITLKDHRGYVRPQRLQESEYDELSENNLLNQILKTTVMLLLRHAKVDQEYKNDLKKEMLFFSNVDTIDPTTIRWSAIRFQRNNNTYRMLISLCQLVLEGMLKPCRDGMSFVQTFRGKESHQCEG